MAIVVPPVEAGVPVNRRRWRQPRGAFGDLDGATRRYLTKATVSLFAVIVVVAYLCPLAYGLVTGLKSPEQISDPRQPILPKSADTATIDGAGPLRILMTIILPQARAAIVAVALFHFFFAWNDFFEPIVYLSGELDKYPISVGLYGFIGLYESAGNLVQAGAILAMAIPIVVFIFGQRFFTKGIDVSGAIK